MEDPRIDRQTNLNVLAYWKVNQCRHPEVTAMVSDILSFTSPLLSLKAPLVLVGGINAGLL